MLNLSHLTSYLTCPRLSYYRIRNKEDSFTELQAVREAYISLRRGFDLNWAEKRIKILHNFDAEVFKKAVDKMIFNKRALDELRAIDWDVSVRSEKFGISFTIDELVEKDAIAPLYVALKAPERDVWFKDAIKIAAACICCNYSFGFVYYAYSGELRICTVNFGLKRSFLKLLERVKMLENGFLPEKKEGEYCKICKYKEICSSQPETFASKFL